MNIKEFKENCLAYLEGSLEGIAKEEFEALLENSEEAKSELESFKAVYELASGVSSNAKEEDISLEDAVMAKLQIEGLKESIEEERKENEKKKSFFDFIMPTLAFASLAGFAVLMTMNVGKQSSVSFSLVDNALDSGAREAFEIASAPKAESRVENLATLPESKESGIVAKRDAHRFSTNNQSSLSSLEEHYDSKKVSRRETISRAFPVIEWSPEQLKKFESYQKEKEAFNAFGGRSHKRSRDGDIATNRTRVDNNIPTRSNRSSSSDSLELIFFPEANVPSPPAPPKAPKKIKLISPADSTLIKILSDIRVPTDGTPIPVLIKVNGPITGPDGFSLNLGNAEILAAAQGSDVDSRILFRLTKLFIKDKNGKKHTIPTDGWIVGKDGVRGIKGKIDKNGKIQLEQSKIGVAVFSQPTEIDISHPEFETHRNLTQQTRPTLPQKPFKKVSDAPLSTFSIDVDTASYTNVRQYLNSGNLPPAEAVRLEEMVNYFNYDYPKPKGDDPFNVVAQISTAPWNSKRQLVHIGLQGKEITREERSSSNLVFLVDVSGSMRTTKKLPLLKLAFKPLVDNLEEDDRVSIVTYASGSKVILEPTGNKDKIMSALNSLRAGGSTNGEGGIKLAYKQAKDAFIKGGNNRVIVATDGDFNVGASTKSQLDALIKEKRNDGIFLTVLGFGVSRYQDAKMESLADKGNGNYFYIDSFKEAHKVFSSDLLGTIFTIAKDVKIQIEFNPTKVKGYRLLGYETRTLKAQDFNNDKKDAGELGSGHTVTALYELIPVGSEEEFGENEEGSIDPLRYQKQKAKKDLVEEPQHSDEILNIKLRYKLPEEETSKLIQKPIKNIVHDLGKTTNEFRFAAAVAEFAMNLKHGARDYDKVIELAQGARGDDSEGRKAEFIELVKMAKSLDTTISKSNEVEKKEEEGWSPWE